MDSFLLLQFVSQRLQLCGDIQRDFRCCCCLLEIFGFFSSPTYLLFSFRFEGWLFIQIKRPRLAIRSLRDAIKKEPTDKRARALLDKLLKSPS